MAEQIRFRLTGDATQLTKATKSGKRGLNDLDSASKKTGSSLSGISDVAAGVAGGIGIAVAAIGAMVLVTKQLGDALADAVMETAEIQDSIAKLSKSVGVGVETLSAYRLAAELSGTTMDKLGNGLKRLSANIDDVAKGTGTAKDTFEALGVAVTDSAGNLRSADDVMKDVADRFALMKDGTAKTAAAMDIFGKAGTDLIPMLNAGRTGLDEMTQQARDLGIVFDEETAAKSERLNDNLLLLDMALEGVKMRIGEALIPILNVLIEAFTGNSDAMRGLQELAKATAQGLLTVINLIATGARALLSLRQDLMETIVSAGETLGPIVPKGLVDAAKLELDVLKGSIAALDGVAAATKAGLDAFQGGLGDTGDAFRNLSDAGGDATESLLERLRQQQEAMRAHLAAVSALNQKLNAMAQENKGLSGIMPEPPKLSAAEATKGLGKIGLDLPKMKPFDFGLGEAINTKGLTGITEGIQNTGFLGAPSNINFETGEVKEQREKTLAELARMTEAMKPTGAALEKLSSGLMGAGDGLANFATTAGEMGSLMGKSMDGLFGAMNKIAQGGGMVAKLLGLAGMIPGFGIAAQIGKQVAGISSKFSLAGGGIITEPSVGMTASGTEFQIGEAGPEAIVPLSELSGGGGGGRLTPGDAELIAAAVTSQFSTMSPGLAVVQGVGEKGGLFTIASDGDKKKFSQSAFQGSVL